MLKRNFHPKIGQKVLIIKNISEGLTPENFRNPQIIENFNKISVSDVENGYVYSINLINIPYIFNEFDLKPLN